MEKTIHLLTTVMNERLQNTIDPVDENIMAEVASMLDELKQLSAALDVRSVQEFVFKNVVYLVAIIKT